MAFSDILGFGLGFDTVALALRAVALALKVMALALGLVVCGLVNITACRTSFSLLSFSLAPRLFFGSVPQIALLASSYQAPKTMLLAKTSLEANKQQQEGNSMEHIPP